MSEATPLAPTIAPHEPLTEQQYNQFYHATQKLQGRLLTLIDAVIPAPEQNKAAKDIATNAIWDIHWAFVESCSGSKSFTTQGSTSARSSRRK